MLYLVTITNNVKLETSVYITSSKRRADACARNINKMNKATGENRFSAQEPIEITGIEID